MKRPFFMATLLMSLIAWATLPVSAQTWTWQVSDAAISHVEEIGANPVIDEVYGIVEGGGVEKLTPTFIDTGDQAVAGDTSPVVDLTVDAGGTVYVISDTAVSTQDPSALLDPQPVIPEGKEGTYKNIAAGMNGVLYIVYEVTESGAQYLLKGYPPYFTEGVGIRFTPRALNLSSNGRYVNCHITLPSEFSAADIDPASVMITKIEVAGVGYLDDLAIHIAPEAPHGVNPITDGYNVRFYRSDKRLTDQTRSLSWQILQLMSGQNKGKYDVTLTVEGSVGGNPTNFQGQDSFKAIVTKKIN